MVQLSSDDLQRALTGVGRLYAIESSSQVYQAAADAVGDVSPADKVFCEHINLATGEVEPLASNADVAEWKRHLPGFNKHMHTHPGTIDIAENGRLGVWDLADYFNRSQLHDTGLYQDFFRHIGTEHQLTSAVPAGPNDTILCLCINRGGDVSRSRKKP